jgi:purine nucleosidase
MVAAFQCAQAAKSPAPPAKVIFDTDIGDDIDDAFALGLLLQSPEVKILGITTAFGDTNLRARLVSRLLLETGHTDIPVFAGPKTEPKTKFSQAAWAEKSPDRPYPDAIAFILETIRKYPGEITLVSVAPLTNVGAAIAKDPVTFRKLKRVVIMGGSINRGFGEAGRNHPDAEWNISCDIPAAQALFTAGVHLYVMPLDSTQIPLDEARRKAIFGRGTPLTNALAALTEEWSAATQNLTPTLFDPVAAAYAIREDICPMTTMRVEVDDKGFTRKIDGKPNANVCLSSNTEKFFDLFMPRITQ